MLKKVVTSLLLLSSVVAVSQPLRKVRHVILIRNNHTYKFSRVTENSNISIHIITGKDISGQVRLVKADTIFFHDTLVRVSDIDHLFIQTPLYLSNQMTDGRLRPDYIAGSHWQIICPPDTVYRNPRAYQFYFKNLLRQAAHERHESRYPLLYGNFLKLNVAKLAHIEFAIAYERKIAKKITWEVEVSAILGIAADAYYQINYPLFNYNGFSVTTYPKFYIFNSRTYIGLVFMYRNLWVNSVRTDWPDQGGTGNGKLQDQSRNDYGYSIRFGFMKRYGKFVVDYYIGAGLKSIQLHQKVYGIYRQHDTSEIGWYHEDHSPDVYDEIFLGPVLNLGVKIGLAFGR